MIAHFKLVWNGWVTTRRMDHITAPCVFGCPRGEDSAQHYAVCNVLWKFLHTPLPAGAGIPEDCRPSADSIFLLSGNYPTEQNARMIAGVYGFYRLMEHCRHNPGCHIENPNIPILLSAKSALSKKGRRLFHYAHLPTPMPVPPSASAPPTAPRAARAPRSVGPRSDLPDAVLFPILGGS